MPTNTLFSRYLMHLYTYIAKMMYKVLNKMGPTSLGNLFTYKDEVTRYNLRDVSSSLYLPKPVLTA